VTPIQKITPQNKDTTVYIQGKVEKTAPLIQRKAYQINDSTGKIWVVTNQGNFQIGEQVVLKGNVQYQSIPLAGQEYGEIYLEEK
jgi:peptide subunit release factor RF-3